MKSLFLAFSGYLALTSLAFSASSDIILKTNELVEFSSDSQITLINEARANLVVSSTGSMLRPDCFKEFKTNFPYAPQTESYTVEKNLKLKIQNNTITLSGVVELANLLRKDLQKEINLGCQTQTTLMALIEGQTSNGKEFKSELQFTFSRESVAVYSGAAKDSVSFGQAKTINLVPTVFFGDMWTDLWNNFDPAQTEVRKNY